MSSGPAWEAMQLLAEPNRRALYAACRSARTPRTREELAESVGISRRLAAFHLDAALVLLHNTIYNRQT